jgi:hypothetical protein
MTAAAFHIKAADTHPVSPPARVAMIIASSSMELLSLALSSPSLVKY